MEAVLFGNLIILETYIIKKFCQYVWWTKVKVGVLRPVQQPEYVWWKTLTQPLWASETLLYLGLSERQQ